MLIALLLIAAGLFHAFAPHRLALDWPSMAVIFGGILLLFVPVEEIGVIVESLEFGRAKILFRQVKNLNESVNQAEEEAVVASAQQSAAATKTLPKNEQDSLDPQIQQLLSTDKEMALMRIGVEIERLLAELEQDFSGTTGSAIVWSRTMRNLVTSGKITPQTSTALMKFRNVRNQLIHPSGGSVPESLVISTVDSGIKLIRILSSLRPA